MTVGLNFEGALQALKHGEAVGRAGWNGRGQYLKLQVPGLGSADTLPYIWIRTVQGDRVPWVASQTDLMAEDWEIL